MVLKTPKTLQEAIAYFANPDHAFAYACSLRWPDGKVICPRCSTVKHSFIKTRKLWFCYTCKKQFTVKVKTVFEDSAIGLDKWMIAVWMLVSCKNGISSYELGKMIGVTQRTAWFMNQRIRKALHRGSFGDTTKMGGPDTEIEADETFVGGITKNMHKDRKLHLVQKGGVHGGKTVVHGILDRNLRQVRATVVPDVKRETLQNIILKNVKYGSTVYTDDAVAYEQGMQWRFVHDVINHSEAYVRGRVHTNGLENFWSLLKRGLKGTYVAVEPFHLFRYVDEQVFRYNNRKGMTDAQRFALAMSQIGGKRLTYAELTGKDADALHPSPTGQGQTQVPF